LTCAGAKSKIIVPNTEKLIIRRPIMPVLSDFFFDSTDGIHSIHARKCVPDSAPVAIVQIAHGIAEHINRYDAFMTFLAENGILAVGNDHLGHGQSFTKEDDKGFFAEKDGWNVVVNDLHKLHEQMRAEYPDIPYVFFGHSMGSFLARTYMIRFPDDNAGVIISGTGHQQKLMITAGLTMADFLVSKNGARSVGDTLNGIAFGSYNNKISHPNTPFDWLSRDGAEVHKYVDDPLCGFVAKTGLYKDMMTGIKFITDPKNIAKMTKDVPVYFMSGEADPVGEYGKGVNRAYKAFCDAGMRDVFIRLYPKGRHEMLNEFNKDDVYANILAWIKAKVLCA